MVEGVAAGLTGRRPARLAVAGVRSTCCRLGPPAAVLHSGQTATVGPLRILRHGLGGCGGPGYVLMGWNARCSEPPCRHWPQFSPDASESALVARARRSGVRKLAFDGSSIDVSGDPAWSSPSHTRLPRSKKCGRGGVSPGSSGQIGRGQAGTGRDPGALIEVGDSGDRRAAGGDTPDARRLKARSAAGSANPSRGRPGAVRSRLCG